MSQRVNETSASSVEPSTGRRMWVIALVLALGFALGACKARTESSPAVGRSPIITNSPLIAVSPITVNSLVIASGAVVRIVYFYANDCPHCIAVINEVLKPLQEQYGERLQIKWVEISDPANYEVLLNAEQVLGATEEWNIPVLIIDSQVLVGEDKIRQQLLCLLDTCLARGGTAWPDIPGLENVPINGQNEPGMDVGPGMGEIQACSPAETAVCEVPKPIWAAYFYQPGCQECSRAEYDTRYVQSKYPQLQDVQFNIFDDVDLVQCLGGRVGLGKYEVYAPAVFIGDDVLIGEQVTRQNLEALVQKYAATGAGKVWEECSAGSIVPPTVGGVVVAGLLDGLNPCAFATLIFFISYLAASERQGREILAVGAAFACGVFLTYLAIGLGLYKILAALRDWHAILGRGMSALVVIICTVLAVFSFLDFVKARRGQLEDMALVMPEGLRKRIRAVIRRTSSARAFVLVALVTGAVVSFLELACTGQLYFATLVSMVNTPGVQSQAFPLLLLYNLMFIVPLVVVFTLVYLGATSQQLGAFLRRHTATVKLGTALFFAALAIWLAIPVINWVVAWVASIAA